MPNCGGCTACCTAFIIKELDKPAHTQCQHCDNGCSVHDSKPAECGQFNCAYIQSGIDNINLRPDKCGVIFEMLDDKTFFSTVIKGMEISDLAKRQMDDFVRQGYVVKVAIG